MFCKVNKASEFLFNNMDSLLKGLNISSSLFASPTMSISSCRWSITPLADES